MTKFKVTGSGAGMDVRRSISSLWSKLPAVVFQEHCTLVRSQTCTQKLFASRMAGLGGEGETRACSSKFLFFAIKQYHCFDSFTQNISFHNLLKMVLPYSHSRMGGNNTAHFEPGTIYIVTVGAAPLQLFSIEPHQDTDASNHTRARTHAQRKGERQT